MAAPQRVKFDSPIFSIAPVSSASGELVLAAGGGGSAKTGILNQICGFGFPPRGSAPVCLTKSSTDDKLVVQLAVSPDGHLAAAVAERTVLVYRVARHAPAATGPAADAASEKAAPAPATSAVCELLCFEAMPAGNTAPSEGSSGGGRPPPPAALNTVAWLPDGEHLAVGGTDGHVTVWQLSGVRPVPAAADASAAPAVTAAAAAAACVRRLEGHSGEVTALAVCRLAPPPSKSGHVLIASASKDGSVRVWEVDGLLPAASSAASSEKEGVAAPTAGPVRTPVHLLPAQGARLVGDRYAPIPKRGIQKPAAGPWMLRALAFAPPAAAAPAAAAGASQRPTLYALESSRSGAAVVTRWECFDLPPTGSPAPKSGAHHALSTCSILVTETPAAPTPSPAPVPAPAPPGSAARLTLPASTLRPLGSPLSLSLGTGAGGATGRPSTLTLPQLGGGSRLVLPQLGSGATARAPAPAGGSAPRPLTLTLPPPGSVSGGPARQALVVPTLGAPRPLSLPTLGAAAAAAGAPTSPVRAAAPPAPAAPPPAPISSTAPHPAPERQWRCVHWTVAARSPVPAMALSPDGSQLALGTSAGEVVVLAPAHGLRRAWATRPIHGFPITGVAFLPRAGCVVSGSADAHVAFTRLRPPSRRLRACCGWLASLLFWAALLVFSVALSAGGMAALAVAVSRVPEAAPRADLPPHQRLLAEVDSVTAGQLRVLGRGIDEWVAEGSPRLLAEQLQEAAASPTWWPAAAAAAATSSAGSIQGAAEGVYRVTRDSMGNWVRVFYPQGEARPFNPEAEAAKAEAEAEAAKAEAEAAAARQAAEAEARAQLALGAPDGGSDQGGAEPGASAAVEADAGLSAVAVLPPPLTPEEEEEARIAAAAAAARASLFFDHSEHTRQGQAAVPVLQYDKHGRVIQ